MGEYVSSKGTTGLSVRYSEVNESVYVYAKAGTECVYHVPDYDIPAEILDSGDNDRLFDYIMENHSSDISECMEALGL